MINRFNMEACRRKTTSQLLRSLATDGFRFFFAALILSSLFLPGSSTRAQSVDSIGKTRPAVERTGEIVGEEKISSSQELPSRETTTSKADGEVDFVGLSPSSSPNGAIVTNITNVTVNNDSSATADIIINNPTTVWYKIYVETVGDIELQFTPTALEDDQGRYLLLPPEGNSTFAYPSLSSTVTFNEPSSGLFFTADRTAESGIEALLLQEMEILNRAFGFPALPHDKAGAMLSVLDAPPLVDAAKAIVNGDVFGLAGALSDLSSDPIVRQQLVQAFSKIGREVTEEQIENVSYYLDVVPAIYKTTAFIGDLVGYPNVGTATIRAYGSGGGTESPTPEITTITPSSFQGLPLPQRQRIVIKGSGFRPDATLEFINNNGECGEGNPCESDGGRLDIIDESTIEYEVKTGVEEDTWEVRVIDDGEISNTGTFEVISGGGEDNVPPPSPLDLTVSPDKPSPRKRFSLNWQNPSDASGVVAVWYKKGSAPNSATDGTRLRLPTSKPFPVRVTAPGETPVYVWLEDGVGNKSAANAASVNVERDVTTPSVTIQEPIQDPSNDDVYETTDGTLTLEGTMSDSQSEIVAVFWLNEATGESGFGDFSESNWTLADIPLAEGPNAIGALALDGAGNIGFDILGVQYNAPEENYSLDVSATNGTVEVDPDKRTFAPGSEVELTAEPDDGYEFDEWTGDASGSENPLTITMDSDKSITASFVEEGGGGGGGPDLVVEDVEADPSEVGIGEKVDVSFTVANRGDEDVFGHTEGDFWSVQYYLSEDETISSDDHDLGAETYNSLAKREPGWKDEVSEAVSVSDASPGDYFLLITADSDGEVDESNESNNLSSVSLSITEGSPPSITTTIRPEEAVKAGAQWKVDGKSDWKDSGATVYDLSIPEGAIGKYTIVFKDVDGWTTPPPVDVLLAPDEAEEITSDPYTRPQPVTNGHLIASNGQESDQLGDTGDIMGEHAVLGTGNHGRAYVFDDQGSSWIQSQQLEPSGDARFFGGSVATTDEVIVAGANGAEKAKGAAYVFTESSGGDWQQTARLTASDREENDNFGRAVDADGDVVLVGAIFEDEAAPSAGAGYIFRRQSDGSYQQEQKLVPSDVVSESYSGRTLAIDGNVAVLGASKHAGSGGAVYVFRKNDGAWIEEAKLVSPESSEISFASEKGSVDIDGDRIVVGAREAVVDGKERAGMVYVFRHTGSGWSLETRLAAEDEEEGDGLGYSVSISEDMVVAGAYRDDEKATDAGAAYVFHRFKDSWTRSRTLLAEDGEENDRFGRFVAASGSTGLIGVPKDDVDGRQEQGSAWVFEGLTPSPDNTRPEATDDAGQTTQGQPVTTDVLTNDSDPDGSLQASTVQVDNDPSNGSTTVNGDGTITYTPNSGFAGTDGYTYTVKDNDGALSNEAAVTITVEGSPLSAPTDLSAAAGDARIELNWREPEGGSPAGYNAYRSISSFDEISGAEKVNESLIGETSFTDTDVANGTEYFYRVTAVDTEENESVLSEETSVYLHPRAVAASVSRSFSDASGPGDYRLVALPGVADTSLAETLPGEAGTDWQAFWDDGSEFVRYDGSDTFVFRKGRGFWLTSRQAWTFEDSIEAASIRDSTTAIPLNDGWTIVANPFGEAVSWEALQAANEGDLEALWPFGGAFSDTSETFRSAASGRAYYLFNGEEGRDSLEVPHPALTEASAQELASEGAAVEALQDRSSQEESSEEKARLELAARPAGGGPSSSVRVGLAKSESAETSLRAPPAQLEATSLRIIGEEKPNEGEERLLMSDQRHPEGDGVTFRVRLQSRSEEPVEIRSSGFVSLQSRSVALLDPSVGKSYDVSSDMPLTINPNQEERRLKVAIGSEKFVEGERKEILPDKVTLTSYPNPSRRQATVEYTLPESEEVRLVIYDVLGRRVAVLEDGRKEAGRHTVELEARRLPSGVYFNRLRAGDETQTQKITVVR